MYAAQYDLSPTTFSPDGKVLQVDYAQKAVDTSGCDPSIRPDFCRPRLSVARAMEWKLHQHVHALFVHPPSSPHDHAPGSQITETL